MEDAGDHGCAGNSAGCGNPIKIAELQTSESGCSANCGGYFPATALSIKLGDSIRIELDSTYFIDADSVQKKVLLYQGFQVPVFSPDPIDTLPMKGNVLVLHPDDLVRARAATPNADTGTFAFSIRIMLQIYSKDLLEPMTQEGLLTGLGLVKDSNQFISSPKNPLQDTVKPFYLQDTVASYQGLIHNWQSLSAGAASAYVYIPGSPYFNVISITDGRFHLGALPYGERFELRFFIIPRVPPGNRKVPSYILTSNPDKSPDRIFDFQKTAESLSLPIP
ncbi:MAG: hypothetical protein JF616_22460 [Fibrobacteres bacterium]|nr:hypothetical protein [Fibrobacterota bacterium]